MYVGLTFILDPMSRFNFSILLYCFLKYFQILTSRQTINTLRRHHLIRQYEYGSCQEVFVLELYMESLHSFVSVFTL